MMTRKRFTVFLSSVLSILLQSCVSIPDLPSSTIRIKRFRNGSFAAVRRAGRMNPVWTDVSRLLFAECWSVRPAGDKLSNKD